MYQYAASAVNSNNKEQAPAVVSEEDDVIIKAFSNIGWGKKWSSLVDTVKKQVGCSWVKPIQLHSYTISRAKPLLKEPRKICKSFLRY